MSDKDIRAAKLTAAGILDKRRAATAVDRAGGQIAPSAYLPGVPRQVHAAGGRAENFTNWFKGSKVRDFSSKVSSRDTRADEEFPPLAVYHGTRHDFEEFRPHGTGTTTFMGIPVQHERHGIFFSESPEFSEGFANPPGERKTGKVMKFHLNIRNPLVADAEGYVDPRDKERLKAVGMDHNFVENYLGAPTGNGAMWENFDGPDGKYFTDKLKEAGYDGVNFHEEDPDTGKLHSTWVAFHPAQVKSPDLNSGDFDPNDNRFTKAKGGAAMGKDSAAENIADYIADLLRQGRGREVTDDLMAQADHQRLHHHYSTGNTGQPMAMDYASRMARAGQMGFDTKTYHGTKRDFPAFDLDAPDKRDEGWFGKAVYSSPNDMLASGYAGTGEGASVMPLRAAMNEPWVTTHQKHSQEYVDRLRRDTGADTLVRTDNESWPMERSIEIASYDPSNLRSDFARFDPRLAHLSNLNAATGGRIGRAPGGYVPQANISAPRLAVAQAPSMAPSSTMDTLGALADLWKSRQQPAQEPQQQASSPSAATEGHAPATGVSGPAQAALDALRGGWTGQAFNVISDYRDPTQNQAVGGAKGSQHLHGNAFDIDTSGWTPEQKLALATQAYNSGFRGFGFYDNNLHFDVGGQRAWGPSYHQESIPDWARGWAEQYIYRQGRATGGEVTDLGKARDEKKLNLFHGAFMGDMSDRMRKMQEVTQKAHEAGVFDGFSVGDMLQGERHPMRITGLFMRKWKPTPMAMASFNRMKASPTIVEHEGEQYVPMARTETGREGDDNWMSGDAYLDGLRALNYPKMGGLRSVKARGGMTTATAGEEDNAQASAGDRQAGSAAQGLPVAGGVRGGQGLLPAPAQASGEEDLIGLPTSVKLPKLGQSITAGHNPRIRQVAREYAQSAGIDYNPPTTYQKVDPARAKRIADAYEAMPHDPSHPLVKASYDALLRETLAQYQAMKKAGMQLEFYPDPANDPYKSNPRLATEDVNQNNHMFIYPTDAGYGSGEALPGADENPLLRDSGERWNGKPVLFNDLFRAVHDYFGHAKEGVGFRADGEENAWRSHAAMYSPLARIALGSETRGQNSWLNYGPHGSKNRTAPTEDTVFADQKLGVLPAWVHHEGAEDFIRPEERANMAAIYARHGRADGGSVDQSDWTKSEFTPEGFSKALQSSPSASTLTQYDPGEVRGLSRKGKFEGYKLAGHDAYFGIKNGADYAGDYGFEHPALTGKEKALVGVVNNDKAARGVGDSLMKAAINHGVSVLDAFAVPSDKHPKGFLTDFYGKYGFKELGRVAFDPKYVTPEQFEQMKKVWAGAGWNEKRHPLPDVVIMKRAAGGFVSGQHRLTDRFHNGGAAMLMKRHIEKADPVSAALDITRRFTRDGSGGILALKSKGK